MIAPCPFCGSQNVLDGSYDPPAKSTEYFVRCYGWQALGSVCASQSEAIVLWNAVSSAVASQLQSGTARRAGSSDAQATQKGTLGAASQAIGEPSIAQLMDGTI